MPMCSPDAAKRLLTFLKDDPRKPSEIVDQALCTLEKLRWISGNLYGNDPPITMDTPIEDLYKVGAVCAVGALNVARAKSLDRRQIEQTRDNESGYQDSRYYFAHLLLEAAGIPDPGETASRIVSTNDALGATKDDVTKLLTEIRDSLRGNDL